MSTPDRDLCKALRSALDAFQMEVFRVDGTVHTFGVARSALVAAMVPLLRPEVAKAVIEAIEGKP